MLESSWFSAPGKDRGRAARCGLRSFSTTGAQEQDLLRYALEFFPSNDCANIFLASKVEQALAQGKTVAGSPVRASWLKSSEQQG
jgi:hypothetical protein